MRILLLGEYSKLHGTLKNGLQELGHEVTLVGDGDGFKNFPVDISIRATLFRKFPFKQLNTLFFKLFGTDVSKLERGIRFYQALKRLRDYDLVQLINEMPIDIFPYWERYFLKILFKQNNRIVLLACGVDYLSVQHAFMDPSKPSILSPYFKDPKLKPSFRYVLRYLTKKHQKLHRLVMESVDAIIASDFDYVPPLKGHSKFYGLIPNPVMPINYQPNYPSSKNRIHIFLGINQGNYHAKGIPYFEETLENIQKEYKDRVLVTKVQNIPYQEYIRYFDQAHILLDQVYAQDQGYNALEAMARGKVVFTGAGKDFLEYYQLKEDQVCIHAYPDTDYLFKKLSWLIENPSVIQEIGSAAQKFIAKEHLYSKIAQKYDAVYQSLTNNLPYTS